MKLNDILYKTPEMTEEKLLELIQKNIVFLKIDLVRRLNQLYKNLDLKDAVLKEYDLIQIKQSKLTAYQRQQIQVLVSYCLIEMTKGNGTTSTN